MIILKTTHKLLPIKLNISSTQEGTQEVFQFSFTTFSYFFYFTMRGAQYA